MRATAFAFLLFLACLPYDFENGDFACGPGRAERGCEPVLDGSAGGGGTGGGVGGGGGAGGGGGGGGGGSGGGGGASDSGTDAGGTDGATDGGGSDGGGADGGYDAGDGGFDASTRPDFVEDWEVQDGGRSTAPWSGMEMPNVSAQHALVPFGRSGARAAEFRVRDGDVYQGSERAFFRWNSGEREGDQHYYAMSFLVPDAGWFPPNRNVTLAQWTTDWTMGLNSAAPIELLLAGDGGLYLARRGGPLDNANQANDVARYPLAAVAVEEWVDVVLHVRWSADAGVLQAFVRQGDGGFVTRVDVAAPTLQTKPGYTGAQYLLLGLKRSMENNSPIYSVVHDAFRRGSSRDAVQPP